MCTEMQTVKNQMTLQNWAQEVAECQSSGMTVSAWCELQGKNVKTFLNGYTGYLVCDGYDGYNKLKNVTCCGCWAHVRRKFYEALPLDEKIKKHQERMQALKDSTNCLLSKGNTPH